VEVVEDAVGTASVYESEEHVLLASGAVAFASAAKHGPSPQAIQGHLPVLFFPGDGTPRRCLGIGLGSGQSFAALLMYPISSLDVVDISPGLVDLSLRRFAEYDHGLAEDARVRFHFDDGRHFVERATDGQYDVVSMEPPPPHADGVFSLYSVDFYREVRRVLAREGVFMQWLPLYRVTPRDALGIIRTQAAVFPQTFLMKQADEDFMVLSFKGDPSFSTAAPTKSRASRVWSR
jgi:spermidine synthase